MAKTDEKVTRLDVTKLKCMAYKDIRLQHAGGTNFLEMWVGHEYVYMNSSDVSELIVLLSGYAEKLARV